MWNEVVDKDMRSLWRSHLLYTAASILFKIDAAVCSEWLLESSLTNSGDSEL